MTDQQAIEKAFTVKWKLGTCEQGERCWCRTIEPTEPIMYADGDDLEPYFVVKSGQMQKSVADYFVELHNKNLGHNEHGIETVQSKTGRIWAAENLEIDGKRYFTWEEAMNNAPEGFRLPTETEWSEEIKSWSNKNSDGAFASPLKLPAAGLYNRTSGSLYYVGSLGFYWSSSVSGVGTRFLSFHSSRANLRSNSQANGLSVRYIKE